jgi:exodeoxyribonuclease X
MKLIVVDTETSDLDPDKGAKLLDLAWIEFSHNGQAWEKISEAENYIQFQGHISPHAQAVHHILPEMLTEEKGAISRYQAILNLQKHIDETTFMVSHNSDFDSKFLPEINRPWICTLRSAKHIWPAAPGYSNQVLRYWLGVIPEVLNRYPHQALYDVHTTAGILFKMLKQYSPEHLLNLSKMPVRLKNIGFGKHRGMPFSQLPLDYVKWLRAQSNLDDDLKHTLDSLIK